MFDITVVITFHREGDFVVPALLSMEETVCAARNAGIRVEARAILDNADRLTRQLVAEHGVWLDSIDEVSFGDLALSRNKGAQSAHGDFLAFLDGDDLWGSEWLKQAYFSANAPDAPMEAIWHPECLFFFDQNDFDRHSISQRRANDVGAFFLFHHSDENSDLFLNALLLENVWSANVFARRSIYLAYPYKAKAAEFGFGIEDWSWNIETIFSGIPHLVASDTVHIIRIKESGSLNQQNDDEGLLPYLPEYVSPKFSLTPMTKINGMDIMKDTERDGSVIISNFNQALAQRDDQIASLNQALAERDDQIANLNQTLSERDVQVAVLYSSNSWRITCPLRIIVQQMKRIRDVAKLVKPAIKRGGGLKNAVRKAMQLYRQEGLGGIKRGLNAVKRSVQISPAQNSGEFDRNDYAEWVRRYDTVTDETRSIMHARIESLNEKPLISVVMPTYNPRKKWLIEAIESVRRQIYPNWELCIADDASNDKAIRPILERYAKEDSRIKVVFREENGHISASSNSALELVTGEWVALLDHDDLLSEHALFWMAEAINQEPEARLIYSDEDKIDEDGNRHGPYFKCDWNVDLFYSQNMFSHLGVYHAELLQKVGGFREGLEGAQDYDLALRCIEQIDAEQICHIPRVLYHWRVHAESTAQTNEAKPYAMLAGERALNEHFLRVKINATSELVGYGYRTHYALPDSPPMVSLIIPTRNGLQLLRQCVESILKKTVYPNYEILIVDNGSDDPATLQYLKELQAEARVRVVRDERPFNYSALNNAAAKLAQGEVLGLLNNDVEVISPDWLSEMVSIALQPHVGAVGARLWYFNNTLQHGGIILGIGGWAGHAHKGFPKGHPGYVGRMSLMSAFTAITGACLIVRKELYETVGGLNESDTKIACNDVDFCLRVREAGYRNVWTPYAELYHHESATRGFEDTPEKQTRFAKEVEFMNKSWGRVFLNDPAYSPNLTLDHEDFSLAWPPRIENDRD